VAARALKLPLFPHVTLTVSLFLLRPPPPHLLLTPLSKGTNRIFDLKTRATNAIRLNVEQCDNSPSSSFSAAFLMFRFARRYKDHLDYKINRVIGSFNSFEREFYDMMRSCFLKSPPPPPPPPSLPHISATSSSFNAAPSGTLFSFVLARWTARL
jgi:hypothetical protein